MLRVNRFGGLKPISSPLDAPLQGEEENLYQDTFYFFVILIQIILTQLS